VRYDLGEQPDVQRLRGVHDLACHGHPPGARPADEQWQSRCQAAAREHADAHMGVGEDRPLRTDQEVAAERQVKAAGERPAVDRADDRRTHGTGRRDAVMVRDEVEETLAVCGGLLEIDAGAEGRVRAGQDDGPDARVRVGVAQRRVQRDEQLAAKGVARCRTVKRQHPHRPGVLGP